MMPVASPRRHPTFHNPLSPLFKSSNARLGSSLLASLILQSRAVNGMSCDAIRVVNSLVRHPIGF